MTKFDDTSIHEFLKDKKKLKIRNINKDLKRFEYAFEVDKINLTGIVRIPGLVKKGVKIPIYKARKFRCKSLSKGSQSGIRIIFAYYKSENKLVSVLRKVITGS